MPKTDLVPTYIDGQDRNMATPKMRQRFECREARDRGEGLFRDHGQVFVYFCAIARSDGTQEESIMIIGRVSANSRTKGLIAPERLHYPVPAVGARRLNPHCFEVNAVPKPESQVCV